MPSTRVVNDWLGDDDQASSLASVDAAAEQGAAVPPRQQQRSMVAMGLTPVELPGHVVKSLLKPGVHIDDAQAPSWMRNNIYFFGFAERKTTHFLMSTKLVLIILTRTSLHVCDIEGGALLRSIAIEGIRSPVRFSNSDRSVHIRVEGEHDLVLLFVPEEVPSPVRGEDPLVMVSHATDDFCDLIGRLQGQSPNATGEVFEVEEVDSAKDFKDAKLQKPPHFTYPAASLEAQITREETARQSEVRSAALRDLSAELEGSPRRLPSALFGEQVLSENASLAASSPQASHARFRSDSDGPPVDPTAELQRRVRREEAKRQEKLAAIQEVRVENIVLKNEATSLHKTLLDLRTQIQSTAESAQRQLRKGSRRGGIGATGTQGHAGAITIESMIAQLHAFDPFPTSRDDSTPKRIEHSNKGSLPLVVDEQALHAPQPVAPDDPSSPDYIMSLLYPDGAPPELLQQLSRFDDAAPDQSELESGFEMRNFDGVDATLDDAEIDRVECLPDGEERELGIFYISQALFKKILFVNLVMLQHQEQAARQYEMTECSREWTSLCREACADLSHIQTIKAHADSHVTMDRRSLIVKNRALERELASLRAASQPAARRRSASPRQESGGDSVRYSESGGEDTRLDTLRAAYSEHLTAVKKFYECELSRITDRVAAVAVQSSSPSPRRTAASSSSSLMGAREETPDEARRRRQSLPLHVRASSAVEEKLDAEIHATRLLGFTIDKRRNELEKGIASLSDENVGLHALLSDVMHDVAEAHKKCVVVQQRLMDSQDLLQEERRSRSQTLLPLRQQMISKTESVLREKSRRIEEQRRSISMLEEHALAMSYVSPKRGTFEASPYTKANNNNSLHTDPIGVSSPLHEFEDTPPRTVITATNDVATPTATPPTEDRPNPEALGMSPQPRPPNPSAAPAVNASPQSTTKKTSPSPFWLSKSRKDPERKPTASTTVVYYNSKGEELTRLDGDAADAIVASGAPSNIVLPVSAVIPNAIPSSVPLSSTAMRPSAPKSTEVVSTKLKGKSLVLTDDELPPEEDSNKAPVNTAPSLAATPLPASNAMPAPPPPAVAKASSQAASPTQPKAVATKILVPPTTQQPLEPKAEGTRMRSMTTVAPPPVAPPVAAKTAATPDETSKKGPVNNGGSGAPPPRPQSSFDPTLVTASIGNSPPTSTVENSKSSPAVKVVRLVNGDVFEGATDARNKPHGVGTYKFADGKVYTGDFADGNRHGQGKLTQPSGDIFEGTFVDNKMTGPGRAVTQKGQREFVGEFNEGRKVKGVMRFLDQPGKSYDGEWLNERPHGRGVMTHANGDVYRGQFKDGRSDGEGEHVFAGSDGRILRGTFREDRPDGICTVTYLNGRVLEIEFAAGKAVKQKVLAAGNGTTPTPTLSQSGAMPAGSSTPAPAPPQASPATPTPELPIVKPSRLQPANPLHISNDERNPTPERLREESFPRTSTVIAPASKPPVFSPPDPKTYLPSPTAVAVNQVNKTVTQDQFRGKNRLAEESKMAEETWPTVEEEEESGAKSDKLQFDDGFYRDFKFPNGSLFTGTLRDGKREGPGRFAGKAYRYEGVFRDDKHHGYGVFTSNPSIKGQQILKYEGCWENDAKCDTNGRATLAGGEEYQGGFRNNVFNGVGRYRFADRRIYEGEFVDGVRHGHGKLTQPNGDSYEGTFVEGKMTGEGKTTTQMASRIFTGTHLEGKKVRGVMKYVDQGKSYDGEWANERPHGRGVMTLPTGELYRGSFVDGKQHGEGVFFYIGEQKSYIGAFEEGRPHGKGTMRYHAEPSKTVSGMWVEGKLAK